MINNTNKLPRSAGCCNGQYGKRQLLSKIENTYQRIYCILRAFLGGGAVLFHLQPKKAVVNDCNRELVTCVSNHKNDVDELIADLAMHKNEAIITIKYGRWIEPGSSNVYPMYGKHQELYS